MKDHHDAFDPMMTRLPQAVETQKPRFARLAKFGKWSEAGLALGIMGLMTLLPLLNAVMRTIFGNGLPASIVLTQTMTLLVTFLGAAIAARRAEHLSLSAANEILPERFRIWTGSLATAGAVAVTVVLSYAGVVFVIAEMNSPLKIAGIGLPIWMVELVIPLGFAVVAMRLLLGSSKVWFSALIGLLLAALFAAVGYWDLELPGFFSLCLMGLALITALGAPLYVAIGGLTLIMFWEQMTPVSAVVVETYRLVSSPTLPAIPLFTMAGFILAAGGASKRLVEVFEAWFGWAPGGMAIAAALVCAFFTTFTGASGVTILALGGLLLPALVNSGHDEKFSLGLLTASGSLGLLFFPSLPVILYAVVAKVDVVQMFAGAAIPGLVVVSSVVVIGLGYGIKNKERVHIPFSLTRAKKALWDAKWELALPLVVLVGFLAGWLTFVETASLAALYAFIVEVFIYKDLRIGWDLAKSIVAGVSLIGAVLTILGVAMGFTSYLIDAEIPDAIITWTQHSMSSTLAFLLVLNVVLLVVGCIMDIFSAIVVIAPLLAPVGLAFGVDPIHMGVIFLANLELGFITPPVGMNLFIASMRFKKSLAEVFRSTLPFVLFRAAAVLLITYVPWLSTWLAHWIKN